MITPGEPSAVQGAKCKRICTWALLKEKRTGLKLLFCNIHPDHSADEVRRVQAEYLVKFLHGKMGQCPVFLIGDSNTKPESSVHAKVAEQLADAGKTAARNASTVDYTFHSYGKDRITIDYIFFDPAYAVAGEFHILTDRYEGYVSDHYGLLADFEVQSKKIAQ